MSTLLTGGTGFVGKYLLPHLQNVTLTTRNAERAREKVGSPETTFVKWQPGINRLDLGNQSFHQVINLMGESIAEGRWTESKKGRIRTSRVEATRELVDTMIQCENLPKVFVSASAIGIYGDSGETPVVETHEKGLGFLPDVCEAWENEALRLQEHGVRVVCLRIGIVMGADGGALEKMIPIFRWGVGGKLGSGKQWVAWIHVKDLVSMILFALKNEKVSGPINATSPNPVRNSEMTKTLAKLVRRPAILPAPKFMLRLVLGEFANSLFFSQRVIPQVALENGFQFQYPELEQALTDLVN